jgi:hypothetical protein
MLDLYWLGSSLGAGMAPTIPRNCRMLRRESLRGGLFFSPHETKALATSVKI